MLDRMQDQLDRMPEAMGVRRQTVEHPFGTLKAWMGATHFLTRTLDKVRTEMSLHVLAYNLKRRPPSCSSRLPLDPVPRHDAHPTTSLKDKSLLMWICR